MRAIFKNENLWLVPVEDQFRGGNAVCVLVALGVSGAKLDGKIRSLEDGVPKSSVRGEDTGDARRRLFS